MAGFCADTSRKMYYENKKEARRLMQKLLMQKQLMKESLMQKQQMAKEQMRRPPLQIVFRLASL
jgi:hypothetical protein